MDVLTPDQLGSALESLGSDWSQQAGALHKRYRFDDFAQAMAFAILGITARSKAMNCVLTRWVVASTS